MNQFKDYYYLGEFKKYEKLYLTIQTFDSILNDIWCTYSFNKGKRKWKEFSSNIPEPYRTRIETEIYHVELGQGINQARLAVKDEMKKYIDELIKNYCGS